MVDLEAQLRRLYDLADHNLRVARTPKRRAYVEGQANAIRAIATAHGITLA